MCRILFPSSGRLGRLLGRRRQFVRIGRCVSTLVTVSIIPGMSAKFSTTVETRQALMVDLARVELASDCVL